MLLGMDVNGGLSKPRCYTSLESHGGKGRTIRLHIGTRSIFRGEVLNFGGVSNNNAVTISWCQICFTNSTAEFGEFLISIFASERLW